MIAVTLRPLTAWPDRGTPVVERRPRSVFRAGWTSTLTLLERELQHLDARDVVVELAVAEGDLRRDGWPRANARPWHPGVRVAFVSAHGPLTYATDVCEWWQHNVRAVALGLEALRLVDRYGISSRGEQYRGWAALPAAPDATSVREAAAVVVRVAGMPEEHIGTVAATGDARRAAVRRALRNAHPDTGAAREVWDAVQRAATVLGVPL